MTSFAKNGKPGPALWMLNHYAITPDMPGGTRHYDLARHLVAKGYDVTIIASSFHHMSRKEMRLGPGENWKLEEVNGVKFLWLRTTPYTGNNWRRVANMLTYMVRSYRIGKRLPRLDPRVPRPDVIIGSTVHLLAVLSAYRLAKHFKSHFIMEVRDLWPQTPVEMGRLSRWNPLTGVLRLLEKFLYRRAERIITLLPNAGEYIASLGIPPDRMQWIPNGADVSSFTRLPPRQRSPEKFTVMYTGAHGHANALDTVLRAAKVLKEQRVDDVSFVFVGDGPEKPALVALRDTLGLANVEFRDAVPQQAVPATMQEAQAFVVVLRDLALYDYGTSLNKFFAYMGAAKPVLLSGNLKENIVQKAGCGITVPAEDAAALAWAITTLLKMSAVEHEAMGLRGREYVRQYHDWDILAERLHQCIQSLISTKAPQSAARP
ncbi:MAG: glycosyltransferase family 4 protein [Chloroflexi bacterium]|nr:glycosyltransferase family 4 protein [Chloroflexota bacterium]